jgi:hypothetical protein
MRKTTKLSIALGLSLVIALALFYVHQSYSYSALPGVPSPHDGVATAVSALRRESTLPAGLDKMKTVHVWLETKPTSLQRPEFEGGEVLWLEFSHAEDWLAPYDRRYPYHLRLKVRMTEETSRLTITGIPGTTRAIASSAPSGLWGALDSRGALSNQWFLVNVVKLAEEKPIPRNYAVSIRTGSTSEAVAIPKEAQAAVVSYAGAEAAFALALREDAGETVLR